MNTIQLLKNERNKLTAEVEALLKEIPALETAIEGPKVLNSGGQGDIRHEISDRKLKISALEHQVYLLDQKLNRQEILANQESLMADYIADIANWAADEIELNAKKQSLTIRLEEVRLQAEEQISKARLAETLAATAYAQAVAWGDVEGEKAASADAQKAANNLTTATEENRRKFLIIAALEQELAIVNRHIIEAQVEQRRIENTALHLSHDALEEAWNEAAQTLLDVGGKLYAVARMVGREPVSLMKLDIPEQGENFGSWRWSDLADRSSQHSIRDLLSV